MKTRPSLFRTSLLAIAAAGLLAGCNDDGASAMSPTPSPPAPTPTPAPPPAPTPTPTPPPAVSADTYVLTSGNKLLGFAASDPTRVSTVNLAVPGTETLLGGDFRPADGQFYVVTRVTAGNALKVYTANISTGALGAAIPLINNGLGAGGGTAGSPVTLAGSKVGIDFNPVANALRLVDITGANVRTGLGSGNNTFVDAAVSAGITETGYTSGFANACNTGLWHINRSQLLLSAVPNGLATSPGAGARVIGNFGVTADDFSGYDNRVTATGDVFVAALRVGGAYRLYTLNPSTGAATATGGAIPVANGENVLGLVTALPASAPTLSPGNTLAITGGASPALLTFNRPPSGSPGRLCSNTPITGIPAAQAIIGADIRPNDGLIYAVTRDAGNAGRLYTIAADGAATLVASLAADPNDTSSAYSALDGTHFALDFNPIPDRLRLVSNTGQNLRLSVAATAASPTVPPTLAAPAGSVTTDTALTTAGGAMARAGITAAAYTNSLAGGNAASLNTTLYALDSVLNSLTRIGADPGNGTAGDAGNPNSGIVNAVAELRVANPDGTPSATVIDIGDATGFEIVGTTGQALMAATVGANTNASLFTVALTGPNAGAAVNVGSFAAPLVALTSNTRQTAVVFGVTTANNLVSFAPSAPGTVTAVGPITVGAGETIVGIDFRPSIGSKNNVLTAVTTAAGGVARHYAVNPANGAATLLSTFAANPADSSAPYTAASGAQFGLDFNPVPDALRTVSDTQQNLRGNPDSGLVFTDTNLSVAGVYGAGYTNNFTSTPTTALFYLADAAGTGNSTLQTTTAPNDGVLTVVGTDLGADYSRIGDIDFAGGHNGFALAALQPAAGGASGLFRINLAAGVPTGTVTSIGTISAAGSEAVRGIAIRLQ